MHILMTLANPFVSDPRVYNEALTLVRAGHRVTILSWDNAGKYPPYETVDGIDVVRSYNNLLMELLPYEIFKLHIWWIKGYYDALNVYHKNPYDIVHSHDLSSLPIGIKLKKRLGIPLIYDAHEIWGYMVARDLPKPWANYYLWKERRLLKHVDHIITVNDILGEYFRKITHSPITIIMNCKYLETTEYEPPENKTFTILYIGTLGKSRFLLELVDVIKEIHGVSCIIGGIGKPDYVNKLREKIANAKNVNFVGQVPQAKVGSMTRKADVIFHMVDPNDLNNRIGLGNKQFEAMVHGKPIICTKGTNDGDFVERIGHGLSIEYNKNALKEAIIKLRDNPDLCVRMGKRGLSAAIEEYHWEYQAKKLLSLYKQIEEKKP